MTQSLSWNLHGNDQLSGVLEKLDRTISGLTRRMDGAAGDARRFGRALGEVEAPSRRFSLSAQTAGGHLDGITSKAGAAVLALGRIGVAAAGAAAAAAVAGAGFAAAFGVKMAAANEDAAISFELMLGSAEKAMAFLKKLQGFAAATPFEMPQLRSAASRLLAVGTEADRIIPILTTLGDATAGMGTGAEGIERAVTALTQMRQKTKVTGEEMMQLTEAGIPAWETLAAKLGVDVATAMEKVTRREVDAGVIFDAVQERTGKGLQRLTGMMEKQSTTLNGVWSTFKDNAGQALATFVQPAMPALKKLTLAMGEAIPKALGIIDDFRKKIGDIFKDSPIPEQMMDALKTVANSILPKVKEGFDKLANTIATHKEDLEKLGRFIVEYVIPALGTFITSAIDLGFWLADVGIKISAVVVPALRFLEEKFILGMKGILAAAVAALGWIPGLGDKLRDAERSFQQFAVNVDTALDRLDGKTVDVYVQTHAAGAKGEHGGSGVPGQSTSLNTTRIYGGGGQFQEFDEGGMVQGPYGSPQMIIAHAGERVLTPAQQRAGAGDMTVTAPVTINVDGYALWQGMLAFKRRSGKTSLGLA